LVYIGQDPTEPKQKFREMWDGVDSSTSYANDWLPDKYRENNINDVGVKTPSQI
jgi:hypothetical protein